MHDYALNVHNNVFVNNSVIQADCVLHQITDFSLRSHEILSILNGQLSS